MFSHYYYYYYYCYNYSVVSCHMPFFPGTIASEPIMIATALVSSLGLQ